MTEQVSPLATFYKPGWEHYQQALVQTIAPLSSEQLALSLGPHQRSIGELLDHLIGARFNWFHLWMGEGDPNRDWNWTSADLEQLFFPPASHQAWLRDQGLEEAPPHTRQWIVWHVLEHEIHHGGELSLALGTYGVNSFYTW